MKNKSTFIFLKLNFSCIFRMIFSKYLNSAKITHYTVCSLTIIYTCTQAVLRVCIYEENKRLRKNYVDLIKLQESKEVHEVLN